MRKKSYQLLFLVIVALFFILNFIWVIGPISISLIVMLILASILESLIPYLIIILILHLINRDSSRNSNS